MVPGKGGLPVLSRRFLPLVVWGAVGVFGAACWDSAPPDVQVVESPTILTTEPTLDVPTPTPSPAPPTMTPIVIVLPPSIQTVIVLTTPTPQPTLVSTPIPTATPTPTPHADTFRNANLDSTAFVDQPDIEPDTCRCSHVGANHRGGGEPHARVRDADAIPD